MSESKEMRNTLNLPETTFPMKANLPEREPLLLKFWEDERIHEKMCEQNKANTAYILHDGPPYANGHIHIGHALNKILKDIVVKYRSMSGDYSPYIPGWDCHGLPIELQVDKNLGDKKASVSVLEKRGLCREYAKEFVDIQRMEFKRLGVLGFWETPYLTMAYAYEGATVAEFVDFVKKGYVYKGKKPVHWCSSCITALAEAEVEYADKESPSVFVKFRADTDALNKLGLEGRDASFVIWTTTPWTLPANLALAVNSEIEYVALDTGAETLIFASDRLNALKERTGISGEILKRYRGSELKGLSAKHPFIDRLSIVLTGDFVTVDEGSGIVHIAPGHGEDDYIAGKKAGLDIYAPVDDYGKFRNTGVDAIDGLFVFKANPIIIEILKGKNALLAEQPITHSYPHCWRCKRPVIFRATEQWFISMKHNDLRDRCLAEIAKTKWVPTWGQDRINGMVKNRPDWCVSRQRSWGVPITMIKCDSCGTNANEDAVLDRFTELVTKHGADVWFAMTEKELLPEGYKCSKCGGVEFKKEKDILDVWFDSGSSHSAVVKADKRLRWPADMYLEGSDQHRGWFQSSLLASTGTTGQAPYKTVLTHGFVLDGKGKKMSKSLKNVVAPEDIIKTGGAEILRLWVSGADYKEDVRISKEILDRTTESYRKIRNTARFLIGNLYDYDGSKPELLEIDQWALSRLNRLVQKVGASYERFDFHEVYHGIHSFCIMDMSSFYFDILKDRLYTSKGSSPKRRAAQYVLNEMLLTLTKLMAPVMSFTAEEVWGYIKDKKEESVFLSKFPVAEDSLIDDELEEKWQRLKAVREDVNKAIELKRAEKFIGNSLEAKVTVYVSETEKALLESYKDFLPTLFIVSQVEVKESKDAENSVLVEKADGQKCERCWNYSATVGTIEQSPTVCKRCHEAIS